MTVGSVKTVSPSISIGRALTGSQNNLTHLPQNLNNLLKRPTHIRLVLTRDLMPGFVPKRQTRPEAGQTQAQQADHSSSLLANCVL